MQWFDGPIGRLEARLGGRANRHEPFSSDVPGLIGRNLLPAALLLTIGSILLVWYVMRSMGSWPAWMLFPSMLTSAVALLALILGTGTLTVLAVEPVLRIIGLGDDPAALDELAITPTLSRKLEAMGFHTVDQIDEAIRSKQFPWPELDQQETTALTYAHARWRSRAGAVGDGEPAGTSPWK